MPAEWRKAGARFGADGLLYLAEWRRGFTVHELRAMFWDCQQVRSLRAEKRQLRRDLDASRAGYDALERRAAWYRSQLVAEARLGAMFSRLTY